MKNVKAWATIGDDGQIVALCGTREEARDHKRYAAKYGWVQKIVKLSFTKFAR